MDSAKEKERLLTSARDRLAAFIQAHPEALDELFRFTEPAVRTAAMTSTKLLDLREASLLCDRITYLSKSRIVHRRTEALRCRGKVIYMERDAHASANRIWAQGSWLHARVQVPALSRLSPHAHRSS